MLEFAPSLPSCDFPRNGASATRPVALDDFLKHASLSRSFPPLPPRVQPGWLSLAHLTKDRTSLGNSSRLALHQNVQATVL